MKKYFLILIYLCIASTMLVAQEVVGASGGSSNGNDGSVSYSVGNVAYTVENSGVARATAGVHQYYEISMVTSIPEAEKINLSVYPNPTSDNLILSVPGISKAQYSVYSLDGKLLLQKMLTSETVEVQLSDKISATYLLKVTQNGKELKTFKIIKK
ncbi:MAG: T9SS type A sorting domain-containing protein [Paludibacter sp.]